MKMPLKDILLYISFIFIFVRCGDLDYLKNKTKIKSFTINKKEDFLELKFDVEYYSDSTTQNYFANTIEKGRNGIDGQVTFFGDKSEPFAYSDSCEFNSFNNILTKINENQRELSGQNIERIHKVCIPLNFNISSLIMVIKYNNNTFNDTIYATTRS